VDAVSGVESVNEAGKSPPALKSFSGGGGNGEPRRQGARVIPYQPSVGIVTSPDAAVPADSAGLPASESRRQTLPPQERRLLSTGEAASAKPALPPPTQGPQVWHRDRRRPTVARVYVGDKNSLELVSLQVSVTVEGPRARTVVDHIFRNPHDRQLEGTFEYPLPTGASPSYFAMFLGPQRDAVPPRFGRRGEAPPLPAEALAGLTPAELVKQINTADWGTLQEARVVGKQKALETYEETVRGRIDPALLEYAGGNTFSGRVFPIPARGYNRVILAYEELLPVGGDRVLYRFPLPDVKLAELQFTLQADVAECKDAVFRPEDARKEEGGSRLAFSRTWTDQGPGGEAVFTFTPPQARVQAISGRQGESGPLYLFARVRPDLPVQAAQPFAEHAVFLLDTSLSEHPDRFAVSMKLLRTVLETDPAIKHFNVLAFNVAASWVEPKGWLENTKTGRDQAFARLDGIVLEGATDLAAALEQLARPRFPIAPGTPLNAFLLSDGQITWGEAEAGALVARFEGRCPFPTRFHCYRTGIGADNQELFEALTRKGGGVFNCFGNADLAAAAGAHRNQCFLVERVRFVGGPAVNDVLVAGRKAAVYPGGDLVVAARVGHPGRLQILLEGTFLGKKFIQEVPVEVSGTGELAPRGWAEIAVAELLALNDPQLESLVIAHCQQFGIASRAASFLVLENENDYKRLNLQEERGKAVPGGDLGVFLEQMWRQLGQLVTTKVSFQRFLAKVAPQVQLLGGPNGAHVQKLLDLLQDGDFELPGGDLDGAIPRKADVAPSYLAERDKDPSNVAVYLAEARRRVNAKDPAGAVRVLSSVIEEYPGRADALRLVGYRLLSLGQPDQAVRLFQQVQRQRPFEPHSYRDLALSLETGGKYGLAAVQYEIILAGTWHNRFRESLKQVAQEEYARMMEEAVRRPDVRGELKNHFGERLEQLSAALPRSDLRVTISWNTDATDVDLWVIEPDGTKCFYQHNRTKNGGELSQDQTQGYGPERYQVAKAMPGVYTVIVHYFRANPNLLGGETHVNVVITRNAGTAQETVERHQVILKRADEQVEVAKVKY
jgi:tetratricopeptide (TPR) repeat protein